MTEPMLMNAYSTPSVSAPPLNVSLARSGRTTWKLNASVPITAVSRRTSRSAGVDHAYRRPSRSWPLRFGTGSTAKNSLSRMAKNARTAAEYDTPLAKKHHDTPSPAMTRPAIAGPMTRAAMNMALLRLTALLTCSSPTISTTNARRAGLSTALTAPSPSAST